LKYLILSLKWSPDKASGFAVWWGPNSHGYFTDMDKAGRYTQEQIDERPGYYDNGVSTLAIPEQTVLEQSLCVRVAQYQRSTKWLKLMGRTGEEDE
jgi:hypothetical protein